MKCKSEKFWALGKGVIFCLTMTYVYWVVPAIDCFHFL